MLGHSSLTRTTNRPLIQKPHNTTPASWANIHDTYSPVLRFWSRNLASHLKKLPSCYLDSPHFFPLHTSKKLREEQVDQRPAPSKLWRMQDKIHNVQTTNNIKNRKKAEAGALLLLLPRLMVTNRLLVLALSVSPNLHNHPTTRWTLFTQQKSGHRFWPQTTQQICEVCKEIMMGPYENVRAYPET